MIDINDIIKKGGATLDSTGKESNAKTGYAVSLSGYEKTYSLDNLNEGKVLEDIKEYLKIDGLTGLWVDKGLLYLDKSIIIEDKRKALKKGKDNYQLAIYDIRKGSSINLHYSIKYYTLYKLNKINNDLMFIKQYNTTKEIAKDFNIDINSIYQYIDNKKNKLLNDRYILRSDTCDIQELA